MQPGGVRFAGKRWKCFKRDIARWVADPYANNNNNAVIVGNGGCFNSNNNDVNNTYAFRCCRR